MRCCGAVPAWQVALHRHCTIPVGCLFLLAWNDRESKGDRKFEVARDLERRTEAKDIE